MTTDFRALCAKVLAYNEGQGAYNFSHLNAYDRDNAAFDAWQDIKDELKSALSEPEPEGPTDEELLETLDKATADFPPRHPEAESLNAVEYPLALELRKARAVLARWGRPAPVPAEGEVAELVAWLRGANWDRQRQTLATRAADLLERLSPPQPVPVSERLPGPGDCTPQGWCWVLYRGFSTWTLEPPLGRDGQPTGWTHWLPAHALPVPGEGEA